MASHEEFLELCAAATAGELNADEQERLDAHLAGCSGCRRAMSEYEVAATKGVAALAGELARQEEVTDRSWSVEKAEEAFFKRLNKERDAQESKRNPNGSSEQRTAGKRFTYHPSQVRWSEIWMPFAASVLLALALGIAAYRTGVKRGTDVVQTNSRVPKEAVPSLEEQASDAGYERAQLMAKLAKEDQTIGDLRRQLSAQQREVDALKAGESAGQAAKNKQQANQIPNDVATRQDEELAAAQTKLQQLQNTIGTLTGQHEELATRAATLEARVSQLTEVVREHERELDQKQEEVARQQDLLEHDRDIRELMGARDLYIAEVHDVSGTGKTDKTYGRVFYTKGKRLIFYAYDLDAQPGIRNVSSFQAWGRRGPDKQQALNLGIFYEDNVSKKRWVLKAEDPKTLEDIDAVFVTVEPNGGSHHPSGKQLLFAYLRVSPNHP
jgi:hypothetical protein